VTQTSLFDDTGGGPLDEVIVYCDGGSRGNPGPASSCSPP